MAAVVNAAVAQHRIVVVSTATEGIREYVAKLRTVWTGVQFEVIVGLSRDAIKAAKFFGTPETLVVATDGLVQEVWEGAYTGDAAASVEKYFGIKTLPGLRDVAPQTR